VDRYFLRNTAGISTVEFLWGLGMPVVIESTFLQLFLRHLGAQSLLIGLIPALYAFSIGLFSLLSGYLTARLRRKRGAVIAVHVATAVPILIFGLLLGRAPSGSSTLSSFFLAYGLFSLGAGMLLPVWQNYLVKIFSEAKALPALAAMFTAQSVAKLIASFLILRIVERYAFSNQGSSLVFTLVGGVFLAGSFMFLITREEEPGSPAPAGPEAPHSYRAHLGRPLRDRNFLSFLGTELEYFALTGIVSFHANFATEQGGIAAPAAAGLFVAFSFAGGILANVLLGWLRLLGLKGKYWLTKSLALAGVPILCFGGGLWAFLLASLLFGASRGTRSLVYAPAVKRLSGLSDATAYFALAPLLTLPLSAGIPLLAGSLLDRLAPLGAWSYRSVFLGLAVLMALGLLALRRVQFPGPEAQLRQVEAVPAASS
jgi:hypothetical protein